MAAENMEKTHARSMEKQQKKLIVMKLRPDPRYRAQLLSTVAAADLKWKQEEVKKLKQRLEEPEPELDLRQQQELIRTAEAELQCAVEEVEKRRRAAQELFARGVLFLRGRV